MAKKDKTKKPKQDKLSMRRVWQNNMYMLRIIHSTDPWLIPLRLGMSTLVSVTYFLGSTYLLQYVLNAVDEGKVDVVLVKDLSRLGRHRTQTALFIDHLRENNVRVYSVTEGIDSFNDNDDLLIGMK